MPVLVTSDAIHPFLPSLGSSSAIEMKRARHQDVRPLEILIINLMADKQATERQLALWLGHTPLQVRLTFAATDSYMEAIQNGHESRNTSTEHITSFYQSWGSLKQQRFDGMIITGVNALQPRVEDEAIWPEVKQIMEWSKTNVLSSLFLCWGAKAALKYFHGIDSVRGDVKIFGLFDHVLGSDSTGIAFGLPDRFPVPVSRWKSPDPDAVAACDALEVVAAAPEIGPNMIAEPAVSSVGPTPFPRRLYILNHPEYDADTLGQEYARDAQKNPDQPLPLHYFPNDDPSQKPLNLWRHAGFIYTNWIRTIYAATPYEIERIGDVCRAT
jgi:homoserine O-succinyltransferase